MDKARDPTPFEIRNIIAEMWKDKTCIEERIWGCDYAVDEDRATGFRVLVVRMKKWSNELSVEEILDGK